MLRLRVLPLLLLTSACLVDVKGGVEDGAAGSTTQGGAGQGGTGAAGLGGAAGGQGGTAAAGGNGGEGGAPNGGGGMGGVGGMPVTCTELEFDGNDLAFVAGLGSEPPSVTLRGSFVPSDLAMVNDRNVLLVRLGQFHLSVKAGAVAPTTTIEFILQSLTPATCAGYYTFSNVPSGELFEFEATIGAMNNVVAVNGPAASVTALNCPLGSATIPNASLFVGDWDGPPATAPNFIPKPFVGSINLLKAGGSQCIEFDASVASPGVDPIPSVNGCTLGLDLGADPNDPALICQ
jgi:hypothetical protein